MDIEAPVQNSLENGDAPESEQAQSGMFNEFTTLVHIY